MTKPAIVVCYFLELRLYPGNGNSQEDETFDNVNGVADSIGRIGCQQSSTVSAHLTLYTGT